MEYFTIKELTRSYKADELKIDNTPSDNAIAKLEDLINNVLDPARRMLGEPIYVNSGYRCAKVNSAVGGAETSQHIKGEAVDITTGSRKGNRRLFDILKERGEYDQLIDEHDLKWIHVSYRKGNNRKQVLKII